MSKVQLAVGQVWKDRAGREVEIVSSDNDVNFPFDGSNNESYTPSGTVWMRANSDRCDLIELVQDENGWRPWKATANSRRPVAGETLVHLRFSNGTSLKHLSPAAYFAWRDIGPDSIVAYKIVEEIPKAEEPVHAEAHSAQHREAQEAPAIRLLQVAADHMRARAATYDKPDGERSMGKTVVAFNAVTGCDLSEAEGWLLLQLLKDVRLFQRPGYHADSAEDCIAYAALKAEAKMAEGA